MTKTASIILILVLIILLGVGGYFYYLQAPKQEAISEPGISFDNLKINQEISSPIEIAGRVNGNGWVGFEGQVGSVELLDADNQSLTMVPLLATTDWTSPSVDFKASLEFVSSNNQNGTLVFRNENPSGLAQKDKTFSVPIKIKGMGPIQTLKAYFNYQGIGDTGSCNDVMALERIIPKTQEPARAAIEQLLKGPTDQEKMLGWYSSINDGVKIQSLNIDNNGVAKIDFNEQLENQVAGSCKVSAIRAQITKTLEQFPSVKSVIISINGRTEDILQP